MPGKDYNMIVAGGGAAGLSLLMHFADAGLHPDQKILVIDKELKNKNDRTWCFWEKEKGLFEDIIFKKWSSVFFRHPLFSSELKIDPYQYKMLRGIDFYNYCMAELRKYKQIEFVYDNISEIINTSDGVEVNTGNGGKYAAQYCFSSIMNAEWKNDKNASCLLQHFKGWVVKLKEDGFTPHAATLMDFRVEQENDVRFVYVLPFDSKTALVEYTVFSEQVLDQENYGSALKTYLHNHLDTREYEIESEEFGVIPMTDFDFKRSDGNIFYIGTAGGQTKASTGFTFHFIQEQSRKIVDQFRKGELKSLAKTFSEKRFAFYDSVLLQILVNRKLPGSEIFRNMFENNKPAVILKFLDGKTNMMEEAGIFFRLPVGIFAKAAMQKLFQGRT